MINMNVELPERMKRLPKDRRGYPVPWIVYIDPNGNPNFAINDSRRKNVARSRDLCGICGQSLTRGRWFIGGPLSAFHEFGAYFDPPMHHECASYALQVCPYLALRKYTGSVGLKNAPNSMILIDDTVYPDRPTLFVAVMAIGHSYNRHGHHLPKRPYRRVEYWRNGVQISAAKADPLVAAALAAPLGEPQPPKLIIT